MPERALNGDLELPYQVNPDNLALKGLPQHRETLRSLGLKRIGDIVVKEDRPEIRGMVHAVRHLVSVEEVE